MIAQLSVESMRIIVEGEKGKSGGLIGCALTVRNNSYDHKRHAAAVVAAKGKANCKAKGGNKRQPHSNEARVGLPHQARRRHT